MNLVRLMLVTASLLVMSGASGCGSPCGNLWHKLERCAKTDADRGIYQSKDMKRAFLARCKKSDKSRVKECIKLEDCNALRRCATRINNK